MRKQLGVQRVRKVVFFLKKTNLSGSGRPNAGPIKREKTILGK